MVDDLPGPIVLDDADFLGLVVVLLFLVHKTERIRPSSSLVYPNVS